MKEKNMRSNNVFLMCVASGGLFLLTSCVKYYDVVKSEFPQGEKQPDKRDIAYKYRRTGMVYDEFETKAAFNALWLSDQLRTSYVDVFAHKRGLDNEAKEELLKRQLEENKFWMSFYVLADIRDKTYVSLSDKNAFWTLYAQLDDGNRLLPELIKEVDLEPEMQLFLGRAFNLFKAAYLVKFSIKSDVAEKLEKGNIKNVKLVIGSVHKNCVLAWDKKELIKHVRKVECNEDFYWG